MDEQGPSSIDALLDLAPSRTNTVPGQFRQLFASKHADSAVYSGLHAANTVCRDWVLQNAPNMTVRLTPPEDYSSVGGPRKAAWIRQLAAVQRALRTRGQLPTGLTLVHSPERVNARAWGRVLDALRADGAGVTCLCLQDLSGLFLTDFMQQAVAAFPNIRELSLENCAPSQFYGTYNHLFRAAVAPLLPQLHRLSVTGNARHIDANTWDVLFKHPAPHLTEFHTSAALDDALLGALLRSAPSLQQLVVGEVKVSLQSSTSRWGLQSLTAQSVTGTHMAGLPELTGGHVNVRHLRLMTRVDAALADAALLMSQCNLSCEHITIRPWGEHEPDDFHTFLRTLASLFTRIVCTVVTVDASTWHLSEHQYTMLAGAMGALPDIQWGLEGNSPLSDQHMSALLAMPPNVRRVCVSSIGPLSQQYSDTVWPWDELTVTHAILTDIQRIPHPSTGRCPAKLHLSVAGPLTDELLAAVMQLGPAVRSLRAHSLQLSDGAHTNAPWQGPAVHSHTAGSLQLGTGACAKAPSEHVPEWRWESLTVTSVDAAQLLRLPWPSRAGCQLQFTTVDLGTLDEVNVDSVRDWFLHTRTWRFTGTEVTPKSWVIDTRGHPTDFPTCESQDKACELQMGVVRAVTKGRPDAVPSIGSPGGEVVISYNGPRIDPASQATYDKLSDYLSLLGELFWLSCLVTWHGPLKWLGLRLTALVSTSHVQAPMFRWEWLVFSGWTWCVLWFIVLCVVEKKARPWFRHVRRLYPLLLLMAMILSGK